MAPRDDDELGCSSTLTERALSRLLRASPLSRMAEKRTADQWFAEYGESHQNHTNELIHWICVPVIFCCALGFVSLIPVPESWSASAPWFNWALVAMLGVGIFYVRLSPRLSAGLWLFMAVCYAAIVTLDWFLPWPLTWIFAGAFAIAWIGQFIGHAIEGKRPSFFKDVGFLLIGPAWLMSLVYKKFGQKY
jgi:uncharacterized membrane protein YGL010W